MAGDHKYHCEECGAEFNTTSELNQHNQKEHSQGMRAGSEDSESDSSGTKTPSYQRSPKE